MVQTRSGNQSKAILDKHKQLQKSQAKHARKQQRDADAFRAMKWIKENPGKTEADYKNMKMDKFKAKTAAMMKKKTQG